MVFLQYLYYVISISSRSLFPMMMMMMMMMNLVLAGPTGLSLKLIHHDYLYPGNLTKLERMERDFQQSTDREQKLLSTWHQMKQVSRNNTTTYTKSDINALRPPVKAYDTNSYMVQLGIGTFSNVGGSPSEPSLIPFYYYFYLDTGSDLLWLQCDPSRTGGTTQTRYFIQDEPFFHGEHSFTYSPIPYNSPNRVCRGYADYLHVPPEGNGFCGYRVVYADGAGTEGVLATEKLTISADNGRIEEIKNFLFGCGYRQNEPHFGRKPRGQNQIAGMLGLGRGEESFISQLGRRAQYKFEYCLRDDNNPSFLRFGSDIKIFSRGGGQAIQTTRTLPIRGHTLYYVIMGGISIGGEPVVYPEGSSDVFATRPDGTGGCIFDSGTAVTLLSAEVYAPFRDHLVRFLSRYGVNSVRYPRGRWSKYDLCFQIPAAGFNEFPTIVFHFSGANYEIEPDIAFLGDSRTFCSIIRPSNEINWFSVVLGSRQQVNHRILHDVRGRAISWINEDCDIDP